MRLERLQAGLRWVTLYDKGQRRPRVQGTGAQIGEGSVTNDTHSSHDVWRTCPKCKYGRLYLQPSSGSYTR
jgi:hypothetical protein